MRRFRITFLYESPVRSVAPGLVPPSDAAALEAHRRFIDELGHHHGQPIDVITSSLREGAPADGFIVFAGGDVRMALDECSAEQRIELAGRLVPIETSRIRIFEELLEPLSLAAAIDSMSMMEWERGDPHQVGTRGLYGRRDVGQLVGAACLLFKSERYCYLQSPTHRGLPHLLADYLNALGEQRSP